MTISLINAAKYYKGLPHQDAAFDYLLTLLTPAELAEFARLYRTAPAKPVHPSENLKLLSQWDNKGDLNKDGRPDAVQSCNVTSVGMVINAYFPEKNIHPQTIDRLIVSKSGSRYSHANLAWALEQHGLISKFSTATKLTDIVKHLENNLVIWSNRLTHSGHIVVVAKYDNQKKAFLIYDPWGEVMISAAGSKYDTRSKKGAVYWLSLASFNRFGMNGANAAGHWAHLISMK